MAADPAPLQEPTEVVLYEQRILARLVTGLVIAFVSIVALWTFKPPQLPGDMAGTIVGGFIGWIGGLLTSWKQTRTK